MTAQTAKHYCVSFQPTGRVFSMKIVAFVLDKFTHFAVLQSRLKEKWTWRHASTMKTDLSYTSDCFETFPFPNPDPRSVIPELEAIGQQLYEARAQYMLDTNQGLTKTYNALKNPGCDEPRILELRRLHEEMDRAVLDAYGWSDIAVPPYCPRDDEEKGLVGVFEDEVIDRLYLLNSERAREEQRLGKAGGAAKAKGGGKGKGKATIVQSVTKSDDASVSAAAGTKRKGKKAPSGSGGQGSLF